MPAEELSSPLRTMVERLNEGQPSAAQWTYDGSQPFGQCLQVGRFSLGNGLTVLVVEDPVAPVVAYHTWFAVGSRHERPGKTGMAHLFEHLMFTESANLGPGQFDLEMEALGADSNAATYMDWTQYHVAVPRDALSRVVQLEAERMAQLVLSQPLLDSEKEVVSNERRYTVEDDVEGSIGEHLWKTAFTRHAYRWPVIGWMSDIEGFTLQDCRAFYHSYYGPGNATVVVVGDVRSEQLLGLLQQHYAAMPATPRPNEEPQPEPKQIEERRLVLTKHTATAKVSLGYRSPEIAHPDHLLLTVACEVLFGGRSAPLVRSLVTELEVAADVRGSVAPLCEPGLLEVSLNARPNVSAVQLLEALDEQLRLVLEQGVGQAELDRARSRIELGFLGRLETADGKASSLGFHHVVQGRATAGFERLTRLAAIEPHQVQAVLVKYLVPAERTVVLVSPQQAPPSDASQGGN